MKNYHKRKWLNAKGVFADSSITAFHGKHTFPNQDNVQVEYTETQLKIKDCHNAVRFHVVNEDMPAFIIKLRTIANICNDFAEYLEQQKA
jgi:hypothetical protein